MDDGRIIVRVGGQRDADAVAAIYAPYVRDTAVSFEEAVPTAAEMTNRIGRWLATHAFLVAEEHGMIVGYAYGTAHRERAAYRWSTDVTVYVAAAVHRRGVGRRLYQALLPALAARGYAMAFAAITLPNAGSVGLHEALGFQPVGIYRAVGWKLGAWRDVGSWQRPLISPLPASPPQPR